MFVEATWWEGKNPNLKFVFLWMKFIEPDPCKVSYFIVCSKINDMVYSKMYSNALILKTLMYSKTLMF